jgi:hypothetical protein
MREINLPELKTREMCKPEDLRLLTVTQAAVDKAKLFVRINEVKAKQGGENGLIALAKATGAKRVMEMMELWEEKNDQFQENHAKF